ncbi:MAG: iron hydrogenase small subunit [Spirochaetota bacterium]|nr:MAG: iron hydrogenase small subunit [Spirochaetota bacterium]
MPMITIDNIQVKVPVNTTILHAALKAGIKIPTLCYLEGLQPIGACRVCLVEVEGAKTLVASCVTPVTEGMKVYTNTKRIRDARRLVVELLLSDHEGDCQTCERNNDCELQALAYELGIKEIKYTGEKGYRFSDSSTPALVRDTAKCVLCRRCVTVCSEVQGVAALFPQNRGFDTVVGPAFCQDLDEVACVQCGQCAASCPVGAIIEKDQIDDVWSALEDPQKHVIVQTAPAIRAALGECFGYSPGTLVTGKMVSALRRLGFDKVFDTNFAADLTIIEEGNELLMRLKKALVDKGEAYLPQFTSCSPGWIKYIEYFYPDMLPHVSSCKSPQQMFGAIAKTYYAEKIGKSPQDICVVSVMPCTAKKFEAARSEMNDSGVRDVDVVLTTRELGRMIKQAGIDFGSLPNDKMDSILGFSSGAADIFANTGGVMEAALRSVYEIVTGRTLPFEKLHIKTIAGLKGIKETSIEIKKTIPEWSFLEGVTVSVAITHGLGNAREVLERIRKGNNTYHFIEIMTCPGGCIGGGGQPRMTTDEVRKSRIRAIYKEDESKKIRKSHENPEILQLYKDFLGKPLGEKSHHLLHTKYTARSRV